MLNYSNNPTFDDKADKARLKAFISTNRLRPALEGHRELIAVSRGSKCVLHGGFREGFGVTVSTKSMRKLNSLCRRLESMGGKLLQFGYCEANLWCPTNDIALSVCKYLKIVKGKQGGHSKWKEK